MGHSIRNSLSKRRISSLVRSTYDTPTTASYLNPSSYLAIYAGSLVIDAVVFSVAALLFLYATLRVSRKMHEDLVGSVLGSTLRSVDSLQLYSHSGLNEVFPGG